MPDIDISRFVDKKQAELCTCPICKNIFAWPCIIKCGHTFCWRCISLAVDNAAEQCPKCRKDLVVEVINREEWVSITYLPNYFASSVVDQLKVRCAHQERGCPETPELCVLEAHLKVCPFAPKCGNCEQVLFGKHHCKAKAIQTLLDSDDKRLVEKVCDVIESETKSSSKKSQTKE